MKKSFPADNAAIQIAPELYAHSRRKAMALQPFLPGLDKPLPPFAEWLLMGLYSLIDQDHPSDPIRTTPTELLRIMEFSQEVAGDTGRHTTYSSDKFELIKETLDQLFTAEIREIKKGKWQRYHKKGDKESSKKSNKLSKKDDTYTFVFRGHVLSSYEFIYPPNVTPAKYLPEDEVENISRFEKGLIIKRKIGPRPIGIQLTIDERLIRGFTGHPDNIGTTLLPYDIFKIRKDYPTNRTLHRLLFYVARTVDPNPDNQDLDKLINQLKLDKRRKTQTQNNIFQAFEILQSYGVITSFSFVEDTSGNVKYSFVKSEDWHPKNLFFQGQEEALTIDGEEVKKEES